MDPVCDRHDDAFSTVMGAARGRPDARRLLRADAATQELSSLTSVGKLYRADIARACNLFEQTPYDSAFDLSAAVLIRQLIAAESEALPDRLWQVARALHIDNDCEPWQLGVQVYGEMFTERDRLFALVQSSHTQPAGLERRLRAAIIDLGRESWASLIAGRLRDIAVSETLQVVLADSDRELGQKLEPGQQMNLGRWLYDTYVCEEELDFMDIRDQLRVKLPAVLRDQVTVAGPEF